MRLGIEIWCSENGPSSLFAPINRDLLPNDRTSRMQPCRSLPCDLSGSGAAAARCGLGKPPAAVRIFRVATCLLVRPGSSIVGNRPKMEHVCEDIVLREFKHFELEATDQAFTQGVRP